MRAIVHYVVALAVLVPATLGGLPYVWCVPMAAAQLQSCCPRDGDDEGGAAAGARASISRMCCESRRVSCLGPASIGAHVTPAVTPPFVASVAMDVWLIDAPTAVASQRRADRRTRAGPSSPLFELHRVYLL